MRFIDERKRISSTYLLFYWMRIEVCEVGFSCSVTWVLHVVFRVIVRSISVVLTLQFEDAKNNTGLVGNSLN